MKYKAIIFDLDGTCLDTDLYVALNYLSLFATFKTDYIPSLKELISFSGPPLIEVFSKYFPEYDFDILYQHFIEYGEKYSTIYSRLYDNEERVLAKIKELGLKLAIVTSKKRFATDLCLKHFKLDQYMDVVITFDDVIKAKPDPEGLIKACNDLNVDVEKSLYVGDTYTDYLAAKACNMDFALAYYGLKKFKKMPEYDYILNDYEDLLKVVNDEKY